MSQWKRNSKLFGQGNGKEERRKICGKENNSVKGGGEEWTRKGGKYLHCHFHIWVFTFTFIFLFSSHLSKIDLRVYIQCKCSLRRKITMSTWWSLLRKPAALAITTTKITSITMTTTNNKNDTTLTKINSYNDNNCNSESNNNNDRKVLTIWGNVGDYKTL